ncbi:GDP-L-fucose synthase family protein [Leeia oryzae]|uniref:GDP-L-fucose synthase family protein n=1 Tax=Leeia oryzae TaxID=356662 RepID=UPI0003706482|nr:GDP-L-fucose synthase [Leeia oryzae]
MKILLTGGSGMVGRNLQQHALAGQHQLLAPSSKELNLFDAKQVQQWLSENQPDLIIHAAGRVGGIQANMREPVRFLTENLDMGQNLVLAARASGIKRLLNIGSSCMYPRNREGALQESDILTGELEPTNEGYALAKITVARLCDYISRETPEFIYRTIIPCNLYGAFDKFDPRWSHLIPAILHKLHQAKLNGEASVEIWGDGTARREFMFAEDLCEAMSACIERFDELPDYMNVGLGYDYMVNEYYQAAAEVVGYTGTFHFDLTKPVGMARKLTDVSRATSFGWTASHSLKEGLSKTYQYYLDYLKQG